MVNITKAKSAQLAMATKIKQQAIIEATSHADCIISSAITIGTLSNSKLDIPTLAKSLGENSYKVVDGDISEIEIMLMTQAQTLNALFHNTLTRLADVQMINQLQVFSDIAFKSQNQAMKTLAVLAELKNPNRAIFIKNQNNAVNQQINNTPPV